MPFFQKRLVIQTRGPDSLLITREVLEQIPEISKVDVGLLHLFIQHTSASLSLNENADHNVRKDMTMALDKLVPENWHYAHDDEGPDDMPAHLKSSLIGHSLTVPIGDGKLLLGTWQGVYLLEHRRGSFERHLIATIQGS